MNFVVLVLCVALVLDILVVYISLDHWQRTRK